MMMPSIFGENLFNDWMDFSFPDIDKKLYGKRADRMMKTDVKETEYGYGIAIFGPPPRSSAIHSPSARHTRRARQGVSENIRVQTVLDFKSGRLDLYTARPTRQGGRILAKIPTIGYESRLPHAIGS